MFWVLLSIILIVTGLSLSEGLHVVSTQFQIHSIYPSIHLSSIGLCLAMCKHVNFSVLFCTIFKLILVFWWNHTRTYRNQDCVLLVLFWRNTPAIYLHEEQFSGFGRYISFLTLITSMDSLSGTDEWTDPRASVI